MEPNYTQITLKELNRKKVFAALYREPRLSKTLLARNLELSLTTVDNNIKSLLQANLIVPSGELRSTGGRKATGYEVNAQAYFGVGIFILGTQVLVSAVDLFGQPLFTTNLKLPASALESNQAYFSTLKPHLNKLLTSHNLTNDKCLGLSFALQGTVTVNAPLTNNATVAATSAVLPQTDIRVDYGQLMGAAQNTTLADIQQHFTLPCTLCHDSKAAAFAELWENPHINNAALFLLNHNFGGALIFSNMVHYGNKGRGGLIEHLKVGDNSRQCYCGNYGCLECYCSQQQLTEQGEQAGVDILAFLQKHKEHKAAAAKDKTCMQLWHEYLHYLARGISNVSHLIDGKIIITGALAPYFNEDDLQVLLQNCNEHNPSFALNASDIILNPRSDSIVADGAGRYLVNAFLERFNTNPLRDLQYNAQTLKLNVAESVFSAD